jgi:hypothetical protein
VSASLHSPYSKGRLPRVPTERKDSAAQLHLAQCWDRLDWTNPIPSVFGIPGGDSCVMDGYREQAPYRACKTQPTRFCYADAAGGGLSSRSIRLLRLFLGGEGHSLSGGAVGVRIRVTWSAVRLGTRNKRLLTNFVRIDSSRLLHDNLHPLLESDRLI